jgi:hypothetical protein
LADHIFELFEQINAAEGAHVGYSIAMRPSGLGLRVPAGDCHTCDFPLSESIGRHAIVVDEILQRIVADGGHMNMQLLSLPRAGVGRVDP